MPPHTPRQGLTSESSEKFLLGIDQGAGSLKATVINGNGVVLGEGARVVDTHRPQPGWSEQNPGQWYEALCQAVPQALREANLPAEQLTGIGLSAGAHIPVLLDAAGEVVRPAIMWSDQRSAAEAQALHERAGEMIIARSMNRANPTWALAMLSWLQVHEPEAISRTHRLCLAKDYLRLRLTGSWATDFSDVVGALMADLQTHRWSPQICALLDWPIETLPPVGRPTDLAGQVSEQAARETTLAAGTPVVIGAIDTTVELLAAGAARPGQGTIKLASAGVLSVVVDRPTVHPPVSCYPHLDESLFYTATGTNTCASAHRWLRDLLFDTTESDNKASFEHMDALAAQIPPGSDGLLFHPYLQGERAPHWDTQLRADFVGITMSHSRAHFCRAAYEGIAFSIRDLLESSRHTGQAPCSARLIGGGARSNLWAQIISDVTGLQVEVPNHGDASYGAALVAGIGCGVFASPAHAVERCVGIVRKHDPSPELQAFYSECFQIYSETREALTAIDHKLHALQESRRAMCP